MGLDSQKELEAKSCKNPRQYPARLQQIILVNDFSAGGLSQSVI